MQVLNRAGLTAGRKITVALSAQIWGYNNTTITGNVQQDEAYGITLEAFGLTASFSPDYYGAPPFYFINNPKWHIWDSTTSDVTPLLVIPGFDAALTIEVAPVNEEELVDISFSTDPNTGEYIWRGLPESGLPETVYTPSYNTGVTWYGEVNGVPFAAYGGSYVALTQGATPQTYPYDVSQQHGTGGSGCTAAVTFSDGLTFVKETRTYSATVSGQILDDPVDAAVTIKSTGTGIEMSTAHARLATVTPKVTAAITGWPFCYSYDISDRHGLAVGRLRFSDTNGQQWTGASSGDFEYDGIQTITAAGDFAGSTKTVSPAFNVQGGWQINDPAPSQVGGVTVQNPESINTYSVTIRDPETETETTYKPNRTLLFAPLGGNGDLAGTITVTEAGSAQLDDFAASWAATGGTWQNKELAVTDATASISRSGYARALYDAETDDGTLTAAELVPHLPHHNLVKVNGVFPDTDADLLLTISAKGKSYKFKPTAKTTSAYTYDLTRPAISWWQKDRTATLYDAWRWERYTKKGEDAEYINEEAQDGMLQGPVLYSEIKLSGFQEGKTYRLSSITTEPGANTLYLHTGLEFAETRECGTRGEEDAPDITLYRNRHLIIMRAGRFVESFANLKSVTKQGYTSWNFPTITQLTGPAGGNRLLFPRDDKSVITIAGTAPVGGTPAPAADMVSTAAYIGWLYADGNGLKVRPAVDVINVDTRLYGGHLELEGFTDLGSCWQGFTDKAADTIAIAGETQTGAAQYLTAGFGDISTIVYRSGGNTIYNDASPESIPGFLDRYAVRFGTEPLHGYIWRNAAGQILRSAAGVILRGDYREE